MGSIAQKRVGSTERGYKTLNSNCYLAVLVIMGTIVKKRGSSAERGMQECNCEDTKMQGYKDAQIQKDARMQFQRYKDSRLPHSPV